MRPATFWVFLAFAVIVGAQAGCSKDQDRILANRRILRGGLGSTTSLSLTPDRDTYVGTSKSLQGHPLLAGNDGFADTQAYFSASAWTLVPSTVADSSVADLVVVAETDSMIDRPSAFIALSFNQGTFDSSRTYGEAGGPTPGPPLAQVATAPGDIGPIQFHFSPTEYATLKAWAAAPATAKGFAMNGGGAQGIVRLDEKKVVLHIIYRNQGTTSSGVDTVRTTLSRHFSLRSPLLPLPTGTEQNLILGGVFDTGLLLHFPALAVPVGYTVNEATLRLRVNTAAQPFFATKGDSVDITVQRDSTDWVESETSRDGLHPDVANLGVRMNVRIGTVADSVITITLPSAIVRDWGGNSTNNGILVLLRQSYETPHLVIGSRESNIPAELSVSYTGPPPGRF